MSGAIGQRKRLIQVTEGNLRHKHLYVADHLDFFPADVVGPPRLTEELNGRGISIYLEGLNETITTDIGSDRATGRPRRMFRRRSWVGRFFGHHHLKGGDLLALERLGEREHRPYPLDANEPHECPTCE